MDNNLKDPNKPSGPVKVRKLKFWVDRNLCIGAGTCVAIAGKTYVLDQEAKAVIINSTEEDTDQALIDAAKGCPVAAIIIEDENGNRIFPK